MKHTNIVKVILITSAKNDHESRQSFVGTGGFSNLHDKLYGSSSAVAFTFIAHTCTLRFKQLYLYCTLIIDSYLIKLRLSKY